VIFKSGKIIFLYDTCDECLSDVKFLMENPNIVYKMKKANEQYYHKYLCPDKQVLNALNIVFNDIIYKDK